MKIQKKLTFLCILFVCGFEYSHMMENPNQQHEQTNNQPAQQDNQEHQVPDQQHHEFLDTGGLNEWGDVPASLSSNLSLSSENPDTETAPLAINLPTPEEMAFDDTSTDVEMNSQEETNDGNQTSSSSPSIIIPTSSFIEFAFNLPINELRDLFDGPHGNLLRKNLNQINPQTRKTPLMQKVTSGDAVYVKLFLDNNADPNIKDSIGYTAINYAIDSSLEKHKKCLKFLALNHKTNLEIETSIFHLKPLLITIMNTDPYYLKLVRILLENGANPSITDKFQGNNSLLQLSLQQLMNNKILSLNISLPENTLIDVIENIFKKITLLLEYGINLQHKSISQKTTLDILKKIEDSWNKNVFFISDKIKNTIKATLTKIRSLMLEENLNLHTAAASGLIGRMKTIIQENPKAVALLNLAQNTPLHLAVLNGQKEATDLLLSQKANVLTTNIRGETPLHFAAKKGFSKLCLILIKHGTDLNARDLNGKTPLLIAKETNNIPLFIFLTKINLENSEVTCPICSDQLEDSQDYWIMECGHALHTECVTDFEKINNRCPFCRNQINPKLICSGKYGEMKQILDTKKRKRDNQCTSSSSSNPKAEKKD